MQDGCRSNHREIHDAQSQRNRKAVPTSHDSLLSGFGLRATLRIGRHRCLPVEVLSSNYAVPLAGRCTILGANTGNSVSDVDGTDPKADLQRYLETARGALLSYALLGNIVATRP